MYMSVLTRVRVLQSQHRHWPRAAVYLEAAYFQSHIMLITVNKLLPYIINFPCSGVWLNTRLWAFSVPAERHKRTDRKKNPLLFMMFSYCRIWGGPCHFFRPALKFGLSSLIRFRGLVCFFRGNPMLFYFFYMWGSPIEIYIRPWSRLRVWYRWRKFSFVYNRSKRLSTVIYQ